MSSVWINSSDRRPTEVFASNAQPEDLCNWVLDFTSAKREDIKILRADPETVAIRVEDPTASNNPLGVPWCTLYVFTLIDLWDLRNN